MTQPCHLVWATSKRFAVFEPPMVDQSVRSTVGRNLKSGRQARGFDVQKPEVQHLKKTKDVSNEHATYPPCNKVHEIYPTRGVRRGEANCPCPKLWGLTPDVTSMTTGQSINNSNNASDQSSTGASAA
ncbi:hypothetical protein T10_4432 [Trichinella papuae]|uniref:Uncharacterized protein n=1 Tax=Trichinella papuae TaxID=268474 RepID=A0A0V1MMW3_9BILA|nr:hypothetical protein T10_4432 [Trichinella papuae]